MTELAQLDFETLRNAVAGNVAAIRSVTRLQAAGGPGDKVFPPTYTADGRATTKYAIEDRRVGDEVVRAVLLDSVASQANRMEEALLAAWECGQVHFPVIGVDFSQEEGLADLGFITTLDAPHRIADALFRDSMTGEGTRFPDSRAGQEYAGACVRNATALFRYCPTALVFGVWNSTRITPGPQHKFQRALVSEIVGVGAVSGKKVGSRIDPLQVQRGVKIFKAANSPNDWTTDERAAAKQKNGTPQLWGTEEKRKAKGKDAGRPASINHGNVAPSIDELAGGVTLAYAVQTAVLSLPALRRLRFPTSCDGSPLEGPARIEGELAARTAVGALALAALALARAQGFDLRSRSLLVPDPGGPLHLELLPAEGGEPMVFTLSAEGSVRLLAEAAEHAATAGFGWERQPLALRPTAKLADLVRKSRALAPSLVEDDGESGAQ